MMSDIQSKLRKRKQELVRRILQPKLYAEIDKKNCDYGVRRAIALEISQRIGSAQLTPQLRNVICGETTENLCQCYELIEDDYAKYPSIDGVFNAVVIRSERPPVLTRVMAPVLYKDPCSPEHGGENDSATE
jgi:hypothetical protein